MGWPKMKERFVRRSTRETASGRKGRCSVSRIVNKDGKVQICLDQLSFGKRRRYLRNPFTTLLDLQWRWTIVIFFVGFIMTWLVFAVIYYLIASAHGDLKETNEPGYVPCLNSVNGFASAFLFSLETQHTIGYGSRNPTSECSDAVFIVYLQYIIGVAVQCVTAGLVVAKLQVGKRTPNAIMFSENACIGKCNDHTCLMVRIGNAGRSELLNVKGSGVIIERHKQDTGEDEILTETIIEFVSENGSSNINLLWPTVIHCQITTNERKFIKKLQSARSELIVIIEGVLSATGQNVQLRTSYLPHEIDIGKQFVDISPQLRKHEGNYSYHHAVDFSDFDIMQPDELWDYRLWSPRNS